MEGGASVTVEQVVDMEAAKTAALLACSSSIGALAAGAAPEVVDALHTYGYELGIAFQLVDDILGIVGDPALTGKSSSSDVRAGKRSAPVVAALTSGTVAAAQLAELLAAGPPQTEEGVARATGLIIEAGGLDWAGREADVRLARALQALAAVDLTEPAAGQLAAIADYIVNRDR
jgi:geranylgeranyl diphosphate synthase type I